MINRALLPLAVLAATAVLAACGSDNGNDGGGDRLNAAQFAKQADATCDKSNKANPVPQPPKSAEEAATQASGEVRIREDLASDLDTLKPPEELDDKWAQYRSMTGDIISAAQKQADTAGKNLQEYQRATFELNTLTIERGKVATELGLKVCSQPAQLQQPLGDKGLVDAADAACREANEVALAATSTGPGAGGLAESARVYKESAPAAVASFDKLRTVHPPASEAAQWKLFMAAYEKRLRTTGRQQRAADAGDDAAFQAAGQDDAKAQAREANAALQLGLAVCGANGTAGV